jgi:SAM-dependent methyltransferase
MNRDKINAQQAERTAKNYYTFRKKGNSLNDFIEIPAMKKLIGNVKGKYLLDAGCGFGEYSIYCAKKGAIVTGIDVSKTMIGFAKEEAGKSKVKIDFRCLNMVKMKGIRSNYYDIAISSLALCFKAAQFFKEISRILKPKGVFCFGEVHPIIGGGKRARNKKDWIVDRYFDCSIRKAKNVFGKLDESEDDYYWRWEHYNLADYCKALNEAGFLIEQIKEPQPVPKLKRIDLKKYESAMQKPVFILIRAVKG